MCQLDCLSDFSFILFEILNWDFEGWNFPICTGYYFHTVLLGLKEMRLLFYIIFPVINNKKLTLTLWSNITQIFNQIK